MCFRCGTKVFPQPVYNSEFPQRTNSNKWPSRSQFKSPGPAPTSRPVLPWAFFPLCLRASGIRPSAMDSFLWPVCSIGWSSLLFPGQVFVCPGAGFRAPCLSPDVGRALRLVEDLRRSRCSINGRSWRRALALSALTQSTPTTERVRG